MQWAASIAALICFLAITSAMTQPKNITKELSKEEEANILKKPTEEFQRRPRAADPPWPTAATPPFWLWRQLDTVPRRLDAIEARLSRLETLLEVRLEQMVEGEKSRAAKEELWREQESRRVESAFDRLERRMAFMETRLAGAASAERAAPRIQEQLRCQQQKLEESVEGLRRALLDLLPSAVAMAIGDKWKSQTTLQSPPYKDADPICQWAEGHVANISKEAASSFTILKEKLTAEFGLQADNFVTKVGNMYSDLWQRTQAIETLLKGSLNLSNTTQREMHEGFRTLLEQQKEYYEKLEQHLFMVHRTGRRGSTTQSHSSGPNHGNGGRGDWAAGDALEHGLGSLELSLDTLSGTVSRRLGDLGRRLDSSFRMLLLAQNLFLESCHRIQLGEPTLEERLSIVLERLLETVSNRSHGFDLEEVKDVIHLQTSQMARMLERLLNITVSEIRDGDSRLHLEMTEGRRKAEAVLLERCSPVQGGANHTNDGRFRGDESWMEAFPPVAAVIKSNGPPGNASLVALFHHEHEFDLNETGPQQQNTLGTDEFPDKTNEFEDDIKVFPNNSFVEADETAMETGNEQMFDEELQSVIPTAEKNASEHKRSAEDESGASRSKEDSSKSLGGVEDNKQVRGIASALVDQYTWWDDKNGFVETNQINSSMQELRLILKFILPYVTEARSDEPLKLNKTMRFPLIQLAKAIMEMYEEPELPLENLYANLPQMCEMLKREHYDGRVDEIIDQVLNQTESNVDQSYLRKIRELAFKLHSNKSP
ncbi:hypothetical protein J437_LFUL008711 [Ladona fulva]|uniref:Uncharacterized protein n=1 Tax=Ladona fulva TaxID=123851 RepID=A0A8K0K3G7_LADFU|nr:hypothetical protein J437_LFUL008711 [Ladona fulva]